MAVSENLARIIREKIFKGKQENLTVNIENGVYKRAFVFDNEENCFIPTIFIKDVTNIENYDDVALLPITIKNYKIYGKTAATAIKNSFVFDNSIVKTCELPEQYYMGRGIIFDKEFLPLFITGYTVDNELYPTIYINPVVFERDDLISKYIAKNLFPWFVKNKIRVDDQYSDAGLTYVYSINIADISHLIVPSRHFNIDDIEYMEDINVNYDYSRVLRRMDESD